ncbi:hypothetical protein EJ03DRAFT_330502 [Teratosphaeria nubilosa]|uniref:Secreted protein n=1 Tax=Teratosphaeria nubilosa TaxID=161662 RepID=A0A6G1KZ97_9PEZI|nr:hypothetical protein EJ03DRAFT_330502 [Teratosphaeria nubilosa]
MQLLPLAILTFCAAANAVTTTIHIGSDPGGTVTQCGGKPLVQSSFDAYPADFPWTRCWSVPSGAGHYVYWENKPADDKWNCHGTVYNDNSCTSRIRYLGAQEDCAYTPEPIYSYRVLCNQLVPPHPCPPYVQC